MPLRYTNFNGTFFLGLVPLAPWLFLISLILVAVLAPTRVFLGALLAVCSAVVVALPGTVVPRTGCYVDGAQLDEARSAVVYSQNTLFGAASPEDMVAQIAEVDADIIVLQESVPDFIERFIPLVPEYSHVEEDGFQVILSRWEIEDIERVTFALPDDEPVIGTPTHGILDARIAAPWGDLRLINVHATPPQVPNGRQLQLRQFDFLEDAFDAENQNPSIPVIAIGDYNATPADSRYRAVREGAGIDAHQAVGCGFGVSWSPFPGVGPSLISIDHAVISGADVEAYEVLDYVGSDHKAIAVSVVVPS